MTQPSQSLSRLTTSKSSLHSKRHRQRQNILSLPIPRGFNLRNSHPAKPSHPHMRKLRRYQTSINATTTTSQLSIVNRRTSNIQAFLTRNRRNQTRPPTVNNRPTTTNQRRRRKANAPSPTTHNQHLQQRRHTNRNITSTTNTANSKGRLKLISRERSSPHSRIPILTSTRQSRQLRIRHMTINVTIQTSPTIPVILRQRTSRTHSKVNRLPYRLIQVQHQLNTNNTNRHTQRTDRSLSKGARHSTLHVIKAHRTERTSTVHPVRSQGRHSTFPTYYQHLSTSPQTYPP